MTEMVTVHDDEGERKITKGKAERELLNAILDDIQNDRWGTITMRMAFLCYLFYGGERLPTDGEPVRIEITVKVMT
jgi:hypothetical protein